MLIIERRDILEDEFDVNPGQFFCEITDFVHAMLGTAEKGLELLGVCEHMDLCLMEGLTSLTHMELSIFLANALWPEILKILNETSI